MALLWLEGFESFDGVAAAVGADLQEKYPGSTVNNTSIETGRFGGNALQAGSSAGATTLFTTDFASPTDDYILGAALRWPGSFPLGSGHPVLTLWDGATRQCGIWAKNDGTLAFYRGGTQVAVTTESLKMFRWYYIELKVKIGNAGSYEIRVDGVNVLSNGSVDTQQTATAQATKAAFEFDNITTAGFQQVMDDCYVCDDTGSANNDFLGDQMVEMLTPNGAGDATDFTPDSGSNFERVDENPADDDTSYVESATASDQDLYTYTDLSDITTVIGVQINTLCKQDSGESLITLIKSGTTTDGDAGQVPDTSYEDMVRVEEQDPDTSAAWTASGINAAQFGMEVG